MNFRIARAFWVAHFTRTLPFLLAGLLLGAAILLIYYLPNHKSMTDADVHNLFAVMLFGTVPVQLLGLLYNASFTNSFSCRLPESTLLLPASSFSIAFHRFLFSLTAVGSSVFLLHTLTRFLYGHYFPPWWEWVGPVIGLCAFLQFVALATAPTGDWTIGFLVAAAVLYAAPVPTPGFDANTIHPVAHVVLGIPFPTIVLSFLGMWANVHFLRQGISFVPTLATRPASRSAVSKSREPKPFKSAWHAQLWLETRRYWRPVSRIFLVLAGFNFLLLFFLNEDGTQSLGPFQIYGEWNSILLGLFSYFAFLSLTLGGIVVSLQNRRLQTGPMAGFVYLRPISTPLLSATRIVAALRVCAFFAGFILIWAYGLTRPNYPPNRESVLNALVFFVPVAAFLWSALWTWNLLALLPIYSMALGVWFAIGMGDPVSERYLEVAFMVLLVGAASFTWWLALKRRLIHPKLLWTFPTVLLAIVVGWIYIGAQRGHVGLLTIATTYDLAIAGTAYAFIVAPLATVPLAHHWSRHR